MPQLSFPSFKSMIIGLSWSWISSLAHILMSRATRRAEGVSITFAMVAMIHPRGHTIFSSSFLSNHINIWLWSTTIFDNGNLPNFVDEESLFLSIAIVMLVSSTLESMCNLEISIFSILVAIICHHLIAGCAFWMLDSITRNLVSWASRTWWSKATRPIIEAVNSSLFSSISASTRRSALLFLTPIMLWTPLIASADISWTRL